MSAIQVIACFVIYSEERIVHQGTFEVYESTNTLNCPSTGGCDFTFTHSYEGKVCKVELTCHNNSSTVAVSQLVIPINRTKRKWKKTTLGMQSEVYYRCASESINSKYMTKLTNKHKGRAATRGNSQTSTINLFKVDSRSSGSGPSSA